MIGQSWQETKLFWRFATGLRKFLRTPLVSESCREILTDSLRRREDNLLLLFRDGIFGNPTGPYLSLMRNAGVEYGDLERLVRSDGVEETLERLYSAGVFVSLEEAKGLRPIRRGSFVLETRESDFDNPVLAGELALTSGGSSGKTRRMLFDFDSLTFDSAHRYVFYEAHGIESRPSALWRPAPPGAAGLANALMHAKCGNPLERWFSPLPQRWRPSTVKSNLFTAYAVHAGRLFGGSIPSPEYVPLDHGSAVARWMAQRKRAGAPPMMSCPTSAAVRVCMAASESGFDIAGSVFRVGGEPLTSARSKLIRSVGARVTVAYSLTEVGGLAGVGCADPEHEDEVHVLNGRVAIASRPKELVSGQHVDGALYLTTLSPTSPKVFVNLETGDCAKLGRRNCGCALEGLGLHQHLHNLQSYEKLNTAGMHFLGSRIVPLVEDILPQTFGGAPTDYQLVEREWDGVGRIDILVSPRVGRLDEAALVEHVLRHLAGPSRGDNMMAELWRDGKLLRVLRQEPEVTAGGKILPLRALEPRGN